MDYPARTRVLFLSTYPPNECKVGEYTHDVVQQLKAGGKTLSKVVAVSPRILPCGKDVMSQFKMDSRHAHMAAAEMCNKARADVLMVEHGSGLYGGAGGEYLLDLLGRLDLPYLVTCHDVPPPWQTEQRGVLSDVCYQSEGAVVMSHSAKEELAEQCEVRRDKIHVLPYGVRTLYAGGREELKEQAGFGKAPVVVSYGWVRPDKGLEYGIKAVAALRQKYPAIRYLILGRTHPEELQMHGEEYRLRLMHLAKELGLAGNVVFVDEYVNRGDIMRYLTLADVCLTPYTSRDITTSGTLAKALGLGRVVVSTPFPYAREMLAGGRGLLANYEDAQSLADCLEMVLGEPLVRAQLEKNAAAAARDMTMPAVAAQYEELFVRTAQRSTQEVVS